ncbi:hypothetical protein [Streptomyces sp. 1331.2]|uniref:hypothetical protein n=1 Tax=Streptomyces sp. 1331.2 TaxID=1938835 RepID=UPI000BD1E15E|nr:hypothetical protein [Streptomyces sp. 1331.2]SOB88938.1 hypothetical protein SAMN06272789_7260 [Streptomyces sp. 1331.2]
MAERQLDDHAVARWLAAATPVPRLASADWARDDLALLPTGVRFDVVVVPGAEVRAVSRTDQPRLLDRHLSRVLKRGPVFCYDSYDSYDSYDAVVPDGTARNWPIQDAPCLGLGQTTAVPRPGLTRKEGGRAFWVVPMISAAVLCQPRTVANLILAGRRSGATCG